MNAVREMAYAKVNLYLEVTERREDGFHGIKTVMHTVSLADELTVALALARETVIKISVSGNKFVPEDGKNLAYRAAEIFLARLGIKAAVEIKIKKNIPMSAGLAGGSADAAAVLRALNRILKKPMTERALMELAAELGSDVPFCVGGKTALCLGRGERVIPISSAAAFHFVIGIADERVSTPAAYAELDARYDAFSGGAVGDNLVYERLCAALALGAPRQGMLYNIFESVTLDKKPGARKIKKSLLDSGATDALMSGSGPSVYGIFETEGAAMAALSALRAAGYLAFYAKSV